MIITISHQKGGVDKSTISWNLAVYLSTLTKVTVIDLDVQKTVSCLHKIRDKNDFEVIDFKEDKSFIEYVNSHQDTNNQIVIIDSGEFDSSMNRLAILGADKLITPIVKDFEDISSFYQSVKIF